MKNGSIGVEATAILTVVLEPGVKRIEDLEDLAERLELVPDAESVEEMAAALAEGWSVVERAG